jgi:hypothetical protein
MSQRPKTLNEILSEQRLSEWLGLPTGKSGRSRQLSYWIRDGLGYAEIAGRRYFLESDVVDFVWEKYLEDREPSVT